MPTLLIYGATGYTGKLIALQAKAAGLHFAIAGSTSPPNLLSTLWPKHWQRGPRRPA